MLTSIWLCFRLTQHQVSTDNLLKSLGRGEGAHFAKTTLRALQMLHSFSRRFLLLTDGKRTHMLINLHLSGDCHLVGSWYAARSTTNSSRSTESPCGGRSCGLGGVWLILSCFISPAH